MKLSIVILFCDSDYFYLNRCIKSVMDHIKFDDYEIITVDNRDKLRDVTLNLNDNVHLITKGYNLNCFEGRKFGCSNAKGEYIWNIDVDDLVVGDLYLSDLDKNVDFYQMYYSYDKSNMNPIVNVHKPRAYGPNVWSRLYSKSMLDSIYERIEREVNIFLSEDKVLFDLVMDIDPTYEYIQRITYQYNVSNATNKPNPTKEDLKLLKIGLDEYQYVYSLMTKNKNKLKYKDVIDKAKRLIVR